MQSALLLVDSQSIIDLLVYLLYLVIFGVVFYFGSYVAGFIRRHMKRVYSLIPLHYDRMKADLIIKDALAMIAVVVGIIFRPSLTEVFTSILPTGDFNSITDSFAAGESEWVVNTFFNTAFTHILFTFFYFVPYFGVNIVINLVENFICDEEESTPARSLISFALDIVTILSINTIVLCSGNTFLVMMKGFIEAAQDRSRIGLWLFLLLVFLLMMYYVLRDLLSSDILLGIFGANLAAALCGVALTDRNRYILLGAAVLLGLVSKLIRGVLFKEDDEDNDRWHGLYGVVAMIVIAIIVGVGINLIGKHYPAFWL